MSRLCDGKLHQSLDHYIANESEIPLSLKLNILLDVSRGLEHLHSNIHPPIIHGDLTGTNVLLVEHSLTAKIADLGHARIIDQRDFTRYLAVIESESSSLACHSQTCFLVRYPAARKSGCRLN